MEEAIVGYPVSEQSEHWGLDEESEVNRDWEGIDPMDPWGKVKFIPNGILNVEP